MLQNTSKQMKKLYVYIVEYKNFKIIENFKKPKKIQKFSMKLKIRLIHLN